MLNIYKPSELAGLAFLVNNGNTMEGQTFVLKNDISLSGYQWTTIGISYDNTFLGVFDGNNHTISGLTISPSINQAESMVYVGLFGYLKFKTAKIQNLDVKDISIEMFRESISGLSVGGIVANGGTIYNSKVSGVINVENKGPSMKIGGIEGTGSNIKQCKSNVEIKTKGTLKNGFYIGGICGALYGEVNECCNYGKITNTAESNTANVGGIAGAMIAVPRDTSIKNSYNRADIESSSDSYGIVGRFQYNKENNHNFEINNVYNMADGHTAFIAESDKSINMDDDVIENVIIPTLHTKSVVKMNKHLKEKGVLKGKHTNKRKLKVAFNAGVLDDVEVFSYSRSVLNAEAKAYVDDIINNEYWFNIGEYPVDFVPILYNADGSRTAGYVFNPDMDDNFHEVYFGTSRSGKTYALTNRSIQKVEVEGTDAVIIFDQTGGFSPTEVDKHIGNYVRKKYFTFWNVYENGVPIDLLDLRGCLTYKDKKDRLLRIYTMMSRTLGSYEEQILKNVIKRMLKDMNSNPSMTIFDISKYICEDIKEDESPAKDEPHRKLLYKIDAVLDDLRGAPLTKNNWGEFARVHGKPIVVISTGADGVGKGSEIIDILLENLFQYKQCHPYEKYTVVIDESQDLYLHEKGAVNTLLRKGGKHGITMLLASQSFPDPSTPFGKVVGNCGRVRGYRSKGDDLARYAERFGCDKHEADGLQKGHCFDNGSFFSRYHIENVITTLKGKTVHFEPAPDNDNNDGEQP